MCLNSHTWGETEVQHRLLSNSILSTEYQQTQEESPSPLLLWAGAILCQFSTVVFFPSCSFLCLPFWEALVTSQELQWSLPQVFRPCFPVRRKWQQQGCLARASGRWSCWVEVGVSFHQPLLSLPPRFSLYIHIKSSIMPLWWPLLFHSISITYLGNAVLGAELWCLQSRHLRDIISSSECGCSGDRALGGGGGNQSKMSP